MRKEIGRRQTRCRETWSGMVKSPASRMVVRKQTGVDDGAPYCLVSRRRKQELKQQSDWKQLKETGDHRGPLRCALEAWEAYSSRDCLVPILMEKE